MQPPSSDTPLIGTYFSCIMLMVACSVVCTVLILNYHERTGETTIMPWWVETIFLQWIQWILMMEWPGSTFTYTNIMLDAKMKKLERGDKMPRNLVPDLLDTTEDFLAGNFANSHFPMANTPGQTEAKPTTGIWSPLSTISPQIVIPVFHHLLQWGRNTPLKMLYPHLLDKVLKWRQSDQQHLF